MDMTIHNGARWNSASAYLRTALNPELVSVQTNVFVNKIIFDGKTATGVQVDDTRLPGTSSRTIKATKEIILSAGAINSPQLLMLSGKPYEPFMGSYRSQASRVLLSHTTNGLYDIMMM